MGNGRRVNSIDIVRLFCAVLVVAIHTQAITWFPDLQNGNIQVLTRIAVPFFFCTSGYFLQKKYCKQGNAAILDALISTIRLYAALSVVYFVLIFLQNPALLQSSKKWMVMDFLFNGSYYHLWYLVGMIYSFAAIYIVCRLNLSRFLFPASIVLYFIGLLGTSYYALGSKIPGLCLLFDSSWFLGMRRILLMGIPFVVLGWTIAGRKGMTKSPTAAILAMTTVLFVAEIIIITVSGVSRSVVITVFLYPLLYLIFELCLANPLANLTKIASTCKSVANFTYFWHPAVILLFSGMICNRFMLFIAVSAACILLGFAVYRVKLMSKPQ